MPSGGFFQHKCEMCEWGMCVYVEDRETVHAQECI